MDLLALPSDVFIFVLCPYLSHSSLCGLDASLTSHKLRPLLLQMYPQLAREHSSSGIDTPQMKWFFQRNIPLYSVSFQPHVTDSSLLYLSQNKLKCASLTLLDLRHCRHTTEVSVIAIAQECRHLIELSLSYTYLRDETLKIFARTCPSITSLDVSNCQLITDESIQFFVEHCLALKYLNISQCPQISCASLQSIAEFSSALRTLNLCYCTEGNDGIIALSRGCPALTSLNLSYSLTAMSREALISISSSDQKLKELKLSHCLGITDDMIISLSAPQSNLQLLDLTNCDMITDNALYALSQNCPSLTSLDLANCEVTDEGIISLAAECHEISSLDLSYTLITDVSITFLSCNCVWLKKLLLTSCKITDESIFALSHSTVLASLHTLDVTDCELVNPDTMLKFFYRKEDSNWVLSKDMVVCW